MAWSKLTLLALYTNQSQPLLLQDRRSLLPVLSSIILHSAITTSTSTLQTYTPLLTPDTLLIELLQFRSRTFVSCIIRWPTLGCPLVSHLTIERNKTRFV